MKEKYKAYYIEQLTVGTWLFWVFPYVLKNLSIKAKIYYLNTTSLGFRVARWTTFWTSKVEFEHMYFNQHDIHDEEGNQVFLKTMDEDPLELQECIKKRPEFQKIIKNCGEHQAIPLF